MLRNQRSMTEPQVAPLNIWNFISAALFSLMTSLAYQGEKNAPVRCPYHPDDDSPCVEPQSNKNSGDPPAYCRR